MDESHRCTLKQIAIHAQSVRPFSGSLQYLESVRGTEDDKTEKGFKRE